ncbi:MAG: S-layer homology domain-containing protein [Oscillospiraceae bacterium]|nr:S-layer homology domain-containing protein [Oscillospiraceae bacterium]
MKKTIIALLLVFAMLPSMGVYGAGTAKDPLISLSYLEGTFIPEMYSALKVVVSKTVQEALSRREATPPMAEKEAGEGANIFLTEGQSFILLSGSASMALNQGDVVDATVGEEVADGEVLTSHRYIVCEDAAVTISVSEDARFLLPSAASIIQPVPKPLISPFTDVVAGVWWHDDIVRAYNRGLVNGMTATTFEPRGQLTLAQTLKLAACMHQLYHDGVVTIENSPTQPWYQSYVDYCLDKGIITATYGNYKAPATRKLFVEIFYKALPESEYKAINDIPDGAISDIKESVSWVDAVYTFYRAGILTGYTKNDVYNAHDFGPASTITRAEVATIMNRMFDAKARVSFTIE